MFPAAETPAPKTSPVHHVEGESKDSLAKPFCAPFRLQALQDARLTLHLPL